MTLSEPTRLRGRPPADAMHQSQTRQRILQAAGKVYAHTGFHGLTLDMVATEAGLSRPTLYKHFPDAAAITEALLQELNNRLINAMQAVVNQTENPFQRMGMALLAWRQWGEDPDIAPLLPTLFAELHNPHSPASWHRQRTLAILGELVHAQLQTTDRSPASPLAIDTLLQGVEFLGYRFMLGQDHHPDRWQETLRLMLRLALGLLGNRDDWQSAEQWAARFGLTLD